MPEKKIPSLTEILKVSALVGAIPSIGPAVCSLVRSSNNIMGLPIFTLVGGFCFFSGARSRYKNESGEPMKPVKRQVIPPPSAAVSLICFTEMLGIGSTLLINIASSVPLSTNVADSAIDSGLGACVTLLLVMAIHYHNNLQVEAAERTATPPSAAG